MLKFDMAILVNIYEQQDMWALSVVNPNPNLAIQCCSSKTSNDAREDWNMWTFLQRERAWHVAKNILQTQIKQG